MKQKVVVGPFKPSRKKETTFYLRMALLPIYSISKKNSMSIFVIYTFWLHIPVVSWAAVEVVVESSPVADVPGISRVP